MERTIEQMALDLRYGAATRLLRTRQISGMEALSGIVAPSRRLRIASEDRAVEVLVERGCRRCGGPLDEDLFCFICGETTVRASF